MRHRRGIRTNSNRRISHNRSRPSRLIPSRVELNSVPGRPRHDSTHQSNNERPHIEPPCKPTITTVRMAVVQVSNHWKNKTKEKREVEGRLGQGGVGGGRLSRERQQGTRSLISISLTKQAVYTPDEGWGRNDEREVGKMQKKEGSVCVGPA
uniref:Uncharacterized protein n=1 Tax=Photinus pyralis TaxID=7054 RepID=A0A1Y1LLK4_PHOPY